MKKHLIVCEVSDNLAKIIKPNGTTPVINDGSLKKKGQRSDEENKFWKMILLLNICKIYSQLFF